MREKEYIFLILFLIAGGYALISHHSHQESLTELNRSYQVTKAELQEKQNLLSAKEERIEGLKGRVKMLNQTVERREKVLAMYNNLAVDTKLKTPRPRWKISIVESPREVTPGETYNLTYQVENLLPIKDSIQVAGYFFHEESWKYNDTYTTPVFIYNRTVTLEGNRKATVRGRFKVPEGYTPGRYVLTGAVSYYDLNPIEYIDRRMVKLRE